MSPSSHPPSGGFASKFKALRVRRCAPARFFRSAFAAIDSRLPGGGLALGALHEVAGGGNAAIDGAAAALFAAGIAARTKGRNSPSIEHHLNNAFDLPACFSNAGDYDA